MNSYKNYHFISPFQYFHLIQHILDFKKKKRMDKQNKTKPKTTQYTQFFLSEVKILFHVTNNTKYNLSSILMHLHVKSVLISKHIQMLIHEQCKETNKH